MKKVSAEEFVRAWQRASNGAEAARAVGLSREAASTRAAHYRRKGIPLKRFLRGNRTLDVNSLIKVAKEESCGVPVSGSQGTSGSGGRRKVGARTA